jgi:methyl-accepting chemotaxis protein
VDQINQAALDMDKVTQQVASNAEESAAASEELSSQAETMNGMVGALAALVYGANGMKQASEDRSSKKQPRRRLLPGTTKKAQKVETKHASEKSIPLNEDEEPDFADF